MGRRGGRRNRGQKRRLETEESAQEVTVDTSFWKEDHQNVNQSSPPSIPLPLSSNFYESDSNVHEYHQPLKSAFQQLARQWSPKLDAPSLIQQHAWPILCHPTQSFHMVALAPTGMGKTLSFGLPIILQSSKNHKSLVLAPTRELVQQVGRELSKISKALARKCSIVTLYGGASREDHLSRLESLLVQSDTSFCIVATTGRLLDLVVGGDNSSSSSSTDTPKEPPPKLISKALFQSINTLVLDEADRLAHNRDLQAQVDQLLESCLQPPYQIILVSATWPEKVTAKWNAWIQRASPQRPCAVVKVNTVAIANHTEPSHTKEASSAKKLKQGDQGDTSEDDGEDTGGQTNHQTMKHQWSQIPAHITQTVHVCSDHKKPKKLMTTLSRIRGGKKNSQQRQVDLGVIFFAKIKTIQQIYKLLQKERIPCVELHSQMSQSTRERNVLNFKSGKIPLLLATDIAARGLHINGIRYVINYDFPGNLEHYVHRCGRAGRDGKAATVYSFFTRNLAPMARDMINLLQASGQEVDPNLQELVRPAKKKRSKPNHDPTNHQSTKVSSGQNHAKTPKEDATNVPASTMEMNHDDDDDSQDFPGLALDRIVLKRASHVSTASDSESDDDE